MKRVKISELKARLSAYLAEVRSGEPVVVCDRSTPVARLVPFEDALEDVVIEDARQPAGSIRKLKPVPLRRRVDFVRILRESRDQR